jgi:hypothetical protein
LAHLIRARIIVLRMHQVDRSLYFIHFDTVPAQQFQMERCNLIAGCTEPQTLENALAEIESIEERGEELLGEEFEAVREATS